MSKKVKVPSSTSSPDTTERKRMWEALQESEEKFRAIFENVRDGIIYLDKYGKIIDINKRTEDILGYKREEVKGRNFTKLGIFSLKDLPSMVKLFGKAVRGSPIHLMEIEVKRKDGSALLIETSTELVKRDDKIEGIVTIVRDITERKRMEEKLRQSEEKYKTLVKNIPQKIFLKDKNLVYVSCNENFARDCKLKPEELAGKTAHDLFPKDLAEEYQADDKRIIESGETESIERRYVKDGQESIVQTFKAPVRDKEGNVVGILGIFHDITERKRLEQELQEKNEELDAQNEELRLQAEELMAQQQELLEKTREVEAATQAKSEFLAHMSHDLRTPLNVIIGFSELMIDEVPGKVNEEQRQCLNDILSSSKHLLNLIDDVLDLSKVESGRMKLRVTNINLTEVIKSLSRTVMPIVTSRKQSLDVAVEDGLPQACADRAKVRQVLFNLLSNATKFTPDGGKLKIEAVREGDWCQVSVIDNGTGIKKEDQERIFEPFCQLDNPLTKEKGGTGLGLTLVKQIIEKHGGQVWVESEYGKGCRFTFTLPLATAD